MSRKKPIQVYLASNPYKPIGTVFQGDRSSRAASTFASAPLRVKGHAPQKYRRKFEGVAIR